VHEKRAHAPVAGTQVSAREERAAGAAPALSLENRDAELGVPLRAPEMGRGDQVEIVPGDAEHRVALEIDARYIAADRMVAERHAEAQAPVLLAQREKVPLEGRALEARQLTDVRLHCCPLLWS